jgi:hypothetical protein
MSRRPSAPDGEVTSTGAPWAVRFPPPWIAQLVNRRRASRGPRSVPAQRLAGRRGRFRLVQQLVMTRLQFVAAPCGCFG